MKLLATTVSPQGRVIARSPGQVLITAEFEGKTAGRDLIVIGSNPDNRQQIVDEMLPSVPTIISNAIANLESSIPRNPHLVNFIQALLALLRNPTLSSEIIAGKYYEANIVESINGRRIPIVAVFLREHLREEIRKYLGSVQLAIPAVEEFLQSPFPFPNVRIWYGFYIGGCGGGGTVYIESERVYEARRSMSQLNFFPLEGIIDHEITHSYMGHESLNQFLELYSTNSVYTNSADVQSWIYMRDYVPYLEINVGVHAFLDIYQLIGWDAMASAFRTVYSLRPLYGVPLSNEAKQVFVDAAPISAKSQVRTIIDRVTY